jgi:hypothetical protein
MQRNFSIASTVDLICGGRSYDLHNDFDAIKIEHDLSKNSLTLWWKASKASMNSQGLASVHFALLQSLNLKGIDEEMPRKEDRRLSFMGFLRPDDESMDAFLPEEMARDGYHMIFCFEGGMAVKVYASSAEFSVT